VLSPSLNSFSYPYIGFPTGHQKVAGEKIISQPRIVSAFNHPDIRIKFVSASDAATIVATEKGDLYALHEYQCRKIASK
jgi:hypothetical protein